MHYRVVFGYPSININGKTRGLPLRTLKVFIFSSVVAVVTDRMMVVDGPRSHGLPGDRVFGDVFLQRWQQKRYPGLLDRAAAAKEPRAAPANLNAQPRLPAAQWTERSIYLTSHISLRAHPVRREVKIVFRDSLKLLLTLFHDKPMASCCSSCWQG